MPKATVVTKVVQEVQLEQNAVALTTEQLAIVEDFFNARNMVKEMTKKQKDLEAQVKEIIGDAEVGIADGKIRIEQSFRSRDGLDQKKLALAFPEAFEACKTTTDYVVLLAK